jgi:hypothetical protein
MLTPVPRVVGTRRGLIVERLAETGCHDRIDQQAHGHHQPQRHDARRRFQTHIPHR